jgi:hypothetical protein
MESKRSARTGQFPFSQFFVGITKKIMRAEL